LSALLISSFYKASCSANILFSSDKPPINGSLSFYIFYSFFSFKLNFF